MATLAVAADETKPDKPPRQRRWVPFSLRLFLALLGLLGLSSVWVGVRGYWQLAAIQEIEKLEGDVKQSPAGPSWLRELIGADRMRMFDDVTVVHLGYGYVTDKGLEHLRGLTSLQQLILADTQVTDAGLEHLRGLTGLQELDLSSTKLTDASLEHLCRLSSLQVLILDFTHVTDEGLEHLRGLTRLQQIYLSGTQVTDAGLEHLRGFTSLQYVWLKDTQVTDAGEAELQRALPDLTILR